jgi:hypothetical protein
MLGFCGLWRYLTHRVPEQPTPKTLPSRFLQLSALGIALVLVSGPLAYSVLLSMALAFVVAALVDRGCRDLFCRGWLTLRATPKLTTYTLGVFAGAVVLLSTAFAWHFEGLAATAGLVTQWLDGFVRWPDSLRPDYPILILMFYEPLILLTGGVGVALATARGSPFSRVMTLWSIAALILALIRPGRSPGDVLIILLPLACLGGVALEALFGGLRRRGHWLNEGLYLVVTLPLWAYLLINVATYSSRSAQYSHIDLPLINFSVPTFLGLAVVAAFLLFFLAVGIASIQGLGPALRGLGLSAIIAALCATIAAGWGVSQNRSTDPRELLVLEPTATDMQLLKDSLSRVSRTHSGDAHAIDLTVLTDDPALNWVLRDFRQTQVFEPSEVPAATSAVIAPQVLGVPPLAGDYLGQSFALRRRWEGDSLACRRNTIQIGFDQVPQLDCSALADWILFRRSPEQPTEEQVVLWLRQDLVGW